MSVTNLPRLINRLSTVPGWAVIPTIQKQSVAEHTLNVIAIADELTKNWALALDRLNVVDWALRHDMDEAIHGDFPTTSKGDETPVSGDYSKAVVKLADLMERVVFLRNDNLLGNNALVSIIKKSEDKLDMYCHAFFEAYNNPDWVKFNRDTVDAIMDSMSILLHPSMEDNDVT